MRKEQLETPKHQSITVRDLKAGDILVYAAEDEVGKNIADSTHGHFSHAALFVGTTAFKDGETLHTGPGGATLVRCSHEFSRKLHGIYVIRVSQRINEMDLYENAQAKKELAYDFGGLIFAGLASWDVDRYENNTGVFKFIPEKLGEKIVKAFNTKGSKAICSGLTLDLLEQAAEGDIFPKRTAPLHTMSPNTIYQQALKAGNNAQVFELAPMSDEYVNRKKRHFFLAGLSLAK
ncbi:hypothetical protein [Vibrio vulnificus]|uniref:hypothetical protein n=1 Tax=Vibrio vulnificus TaxID=672 RepID=UPI0019D4D6CB|nr:hypothetical protein [Vibrio vulnificus]MBN8035180.1 hypothetical protein [Vibrio vulnificus]